MFRDSFRRIASVLLTLALVFVQVPKNLYHSCANDHQELCHHSNHDQDSSFSSLDDDCLVCSLDSCFEAVIQYAPVQVAGLFTTRQFIEYRDIPELSPQGIKQLRAPPVALI